VLERFLVRVELHTYAQSEPCESGAAVAGIISA